MVGNLPCVRVFLVKWSENLSHTSQVWNTELESLLERLSIFLGNLVYGVQFIKGYCWILGLAAAACSFAIWIYIEYPPGNACCVVAASEMPQFAGMVVRSYVQSAQG